MVGLEESSYFLKSNFNLESPGPHKMPNRKIGSKIRKHHFAVLAVWVCPNLSGFVLMLPVSIPSKRVTTHTSKKQ